MNIEKEIEAIHDKISELEIRSLENLNKIQNLRDSNTFRDAIIILFLNGKNDEAIEKYKRFKAIFKY